MRDPWVKDYLDKKVIGTLLEYGFTYMKIDCNDTIGLGCDGAESQGEGLRQNMEASFAFIEKIKSKVPGIVLENCASGGHRLEPLMMGACSMASFSDAHECEEIPIIAANLHRVILPRQSQIWAVVHTGDSLKRIAYSMANTFLGRMCLSGDVLELSEEQWQLIDSGIAFYHQIAPIVRDGYTHRFGPEIASYRHPKGWQGILRVGDNGDAFALFHVFHGELPAKCTIEIPEEYEFEMDERYSDAETDIVLEHGRLVYTPSDNMKAAAVYLKRK